MSLRGGRRGDPNVSRSPPKVPSVRTSVRWALAAAVLVSGPARASDAPGDVDDVFFIAKSENKNRVLYGLHLDARCTPSGPAPMFAYWRMLERGPRVVEPLLEREAPAYGIASQRIVERDAQGGRLRLSLRALPERFIDVTWGERGGSCYARARTTIQGTPATLESVFVQLKWPFGISYLLLGGRDAEGHVLREKVSP